MSDSTDLVAIDVLKPAEVFTPGGVDKIITEVTAKVRAMTFDASTDEGRAEIKSVAYRVARSKTALDDMGKTFVAELKRAAGVVDADRRTIRDRFDALRDEVRKPVDEWEAAEDKRVADHVAALDDLKALGEFPPGTEPTLDEIESRMVTLEVPRSRDWQEFSERATQLMERIGPALMALHAAAMKREAERAELERLRKAEADRQAAAESERLAREQQERDVLIANAAAERVQAEAQAQVARAEQQRVAAEQAAAAAAAQAERDKKAALERAEREKDAAVERERQRVADVARQEAAATAAREANKSHRAKINNAAVAALMGAAGLDEATAKDVVKAIASGKISNITISY